jgi:hypothetical protein
VAIAEKLLLIWLRDSCGTDAPLPLPDEPEDELLLLPQAAMTRAALPATAVSAALLVTEPNWTTSLWGGTDRSKYWGRAVSRLCRRPSIGENSKPTRINRAVNISVTS